MTRISCGFFLLDLSSTLGYQAVINRPLVILKLWDLHGNGSFCSLSVRKKKDTSDVSAMYFFFNFDVLYLPARRLWRGLQELYQKFQNSGKLS